MSKQVLRFLYFAIPVLFLGFQVSAESEMVCTELYDPVCAKQQVQCVKAPCDPVERTFSNECKAMAVGAEILHKGECKSLDAEKSVKESIKKQKVKYKDPSKDPNCKAWFDGCNSCARSYTGGPARCTMRYCTHDKKEGGKIECKLYFEEERKDELLSPEGQVVQDFDKPPVIFKRPPVPMDEPGEINPIFDVDTQAVEIIKDELESYASDALEGKERINLSGNIFKSYYDGSIFLNLEPKNSFDKNINILGFIDPQKGRFTAYEASAGVVELTDSMGRVLGSWSLRLDNDWQDKALQGKKLWFELNIDSTKYKNGSYVLRFRNENPSGSPENDAEFQISIKIKHPEKQLSRREMLIKKYKDYKFLSYDEKAKVFKMQKVKKVKLFGLVPLNMKELIEVDENTLLVKDKKTPWWSWLAF